MFPKTQFSATVTIYTYYFAENLQKATYIRKVLANCYWHADNGAVKQSGGISTKDHVMIEVPLFNNANYVSPELFATLNLSQITYLAQWAVDIGADLEATRILMGQINKEFEWLNDEELGQEMTSFERENHGLVYRAVNTEAFTQFDRQLSLLKISARR